ncbi:MAG: hypothetical protein L0211_19575 [Planctomycetaceae bacterium]|nr:hypothetical protein [Planctomycetaceae bacterium]
MKQILLAAAVAAALSGFAGCQQSGTPTVETFEAPVQDALVEAKTVLQRYADGSPVTSEAEGFANLAQRVKEKDPAKGEILDKGLAEIKANPNIAKAKAAELLKKL